MNPFEFTVTYLCTGIALAQLISIAESLKQIASALRDIRNGMGMR